MFYDVGVELFKYLLEEVQINLVFYEVSSALFVLSIVFYEGCCALSLETLVFCEVPARLFY